MCSLAPATIIASAPVVATVAVAAPAVVPATTYITEPTRVVPPAPNNIINGANGATYVTNSVPGSTAALNPAVAVVAAPACAATYTQLL
jgi:hypothetical protein